MTPIQQLMLGVGAKKKTYMDDVFSTQLWTGNSSSPRTITTGFDMASDGGMVWIKKRNSGTESDHIIGGTGLSDNNYISSNSTAAKTGHAGRFRSLTSTGFEIGSSGYVNETHTYSGWAFKQAPGFFDVVTWTGNSDTNQTISHSLSSIPGMIIAKRTDSSTTGDWVVYHRDHAGYLRLNTSQAAVNDSGAWTPVTSTSFKAYDYINVNGASYVAYVFAGGESTAATARSVDFDGSDDGLTVPNSSDFSFGSGDFTVEGWVKIDQNTNQNALVGVWRYQNGRRSWTIQTDDSTRKLEFYVNSGGGTVTNHLTSGGTVPVGQWFHFAGVRHGNTIKLFINGNKVAETAYTSSIYDNTNDPLIIGNQSFGIDYTDGKISNIRITKGQALYTTSFKVPTEPLTTTSQGATASNVKLLCCNNSSVTGSTVTPTTISNTGSTASTDSPFDDPAAFTFGDSEEGIVKCGSYKGNGSSDGVEINLGFEPQWILMKDADDGNAHWSLFDSMRGIVDGGNDMELNPNTNNDEGTGNNRIKLTSRGFKLETSHNDFNSSSHSYIYMAIRRPDGYVGKPADAGTDVFAMDAGNGSSTIPSLDSGFPVDFAFVKRLASTGDWDTSARLIHGKFVDTNTSGAQQTSTGYTFDSNLGWGSADWLDSGIQSWMWKRHAGFDVVTYKSGSPNITQFSHNLNKVPEMMWVKRRDGTGSWQIYHKGYNGGTNPWYYFLELNQNYAQDTGSRWNNTAPTSTHFSLGAVDTVNGAASNNYDYVAMLFASVDGISKVGYYDGTGSDQTISLGFTPRFLIFKCSTNNRDWHVFDSTRGINGSSGNDPALRFNSSDAQYSGENYIEPATNGILVKGSSVAVNENNHKYIYYAHA